MLINHYTQNITRFQLKLWNEDTILPFSQFWLCIIQFSQVNRLHPLSIKRLRCSQNISIPRHANVEVEFVRVGSHYKTFVSPHKVFRGLIFFWFCYFHGNKILAPESAKESPSGPNNPHKFVRQIKLQNNNNISNKSIKYEQV